MSWIQRHWPVVFGAGGLAVAAFRALGDLDFLIERYRDPGWVGEVMNILTDLPGWIFLVLAVSGLALIGWDVLWRQRLLLNDSVRRIKHLSQAEYDALTPPDPTTLYLITDKDGGRDDPAAYSKLAAYITSYVLPACHAMDDLQYAVISSLTDNSELTRLAVDACRAEAEVSPLHASRSFLSDKFDSTDAEDIRLTMAIQHVDTIYRHYKALRTQTDRLAATAQIDAQAHPRTAAEWFHWARAHNSLIDAHEGIKKDKRFGMLFGPSSKNRRWGDKVPLPSAPHPTR